MSDKVFRERINDYVDSVFAIIGFINLFRYDDTSKKMKETVKVCQGRRMQTSPSNRISPEGEVTPDICLLDQHLNKGIVGEVKKSFPENRDFWMDDFRQLMSYDDDLTNWMSNTGTIDDHEIVLLPEQARSRAVIRYFEERAAKEISFNKNFVIVEFNRNNQAKAYFFFRKEHGDLKHFPELNRRLEEGVMVPLEKLMPHYETIKLYDSPPPMPYFLHLIWENVILLRASQKDKFRTAKKLQLEVTIDEILQELHENYSFKKLNADNENFQPVVPTKTLVTESIDALITFKLAEWTDRPAGKCKVFFQRFKDTLEEFIVLCNKHGIDCKVTSAQLELFPKNLSGKD